MNLAPNSTSRLKFKLDIMTVEELKKLLKLLSIKIAPMKKHGIIATILGELKTIDLREIWERLDPLQRTAVSEAVHSWNGTFNASHFGIKYGGKPEFYTAGKYSYQRDPTPLSLLIFGSEIPIELLERLREFVPAPESTKLKSSETIPQTHGEPRGGYRRWKRTSESGEHPLQVVTREMEVSAQNELMDILRLIHAGKVSVSDKTMLPSASTVSLIGVTLQGGDFYDGSAFEDYESFEEPGAIRSVAWPIILQGGRLAELSGKRLSLTNNGRKALHSPPSETIRAVWNAWLESRVLDELRRIDAIKGQTGKGKNGLTAVGNRRETIANALAECPVGRWVEVDDFFDHVQLSGNNFEVTRNAWNLYISDPNYGSLGYDGTGWEILGGRYTLCILFEYAATMGLVDVAYVHPSGARADYSDLWGTDDLWFLSRYDGLLYFRLTPLGAYCLGVADSYSPSPLQVDTTLRVMPNYEIAVINRRGSTGDVAFLELFADSVSEDLWRLSEPRILAAIEHGRTVHELRDMLVNRGGSDLPPTVERLLQDIETRSHSLTDLGGARLIECKDHVVAQLISNDTRTKRYCCLAGERCLAVPLDMESAFRRGLRQMGYCLPPPPAKRGPSG